jgi:heme O synthase-like polyprenyltransferase
MECNVGNKDRSYRIVIGLILVVLGFWYSLWLAVVGTILILTGLIRYCGLYSLFGINTNKKRVLADKPSRRAKTKKRR